MKLIHYSKYYRNTENNPELLWKAMSIKLEYIDKTDAILDTWINNTAKLRQKYTKYWIRSITNNETESVIKVFQKSKAQNLMGFTIEF